ncbi:MAG: serine/threonine-protein kinase [Polyangiaceae bacterium]
MQQGDVVGGRFTIEELAGSGGMGAVYRATDAQTGERVAVKVLHSAAASDVARFEREARVLETLKHPGIVRSFARGRTPKGESYLVLEWLEGEDLLRALKKRKPTHAEAVVLASKVASALGRAHEAGVIHRDIKPGNIFLVGGRFDQPRVLDFGIARLVAATTAMTKTGTAMGTPSYMPPEQARGLRTIDARADVYSIGCVLFECVTGEAPYDGEHVIAILARVLFDETPRAGQEGRARPARARRRDLRAHVEGTPVFGPRTDSEVERLLARLSLEGPIARRARGARDGRPARSPRAEAPRRHRGDAGEADVDARRAGGDPRGRHLDDVVRRGRGAPRDVRREVLSARGRLCDPRARGRRLRGGRRAARRALRVLFRARSGLDVSVAMGRGDAEGKVPIGDVVDSVAKLAKLPVIRRSPGDPAIRIDELLAGLLDDRFEIERDADGLVLRGEKANDPGQRLVLGRPSPCLGRAREIGTIDAVFAECEDRPAGRCVVLTGAPGLGKSRVRYEWLERLRKSDRPATVWIGRADPLASGSSSGRSQARYAAGLASPRRTIWGSRVRRSASACGPTPRTPITRGASRRSSGRSSASRSTTRTTSSSARRAATRP